MKIGTNPPIQIKLSDCESALFILGQKNFVQHFSISNKYLYKSWLSKNTVSRQKTNLRIVVSELFF